MLTRRELKINFGFGFYTTTNRNQAIAFSEKVVRRRHAGERAVSIYDLNEEAAFGACSVLRFPAANEDWLEFVSANRDGTYTGTTYDLIIGPVANDDVYTTFMLFRSGVLSKEQTLEALKIRKLYDQVVFTTEKALAFLRFTGTVPREDLT